MVRRHLSIFLVLMIFVFAVIKVNAQYSATDTISLSLKASVNCDTIEYTDEFELLLLFRNNQEHPVDVLLGSNLILTYKESLSQHLNYIDGNCPIKKKTLQGHETYRLKLMVKASDLLRWNGKNEFLVFYFAKNGGVKYFAFSDYLTIYCKKELENEN